MRQSPTITIAALNGASAGGGLGLALACDARIASPQAKMAASYAGMGLSPDGGTTWLLPRLVGEQTSRRFFLENEIWSAEQCVAVGAADALVEADKLIDAACSMAARWSQWGEHTKEATKHLLHVQSAQDFESHLNHERTLIEAAGTTEAFKEGVTAFFEKRKPVFHKE
jgi:2-(1,2-epoxy-1,2-dihydrophenyl)acetyl-CoA isomerase